MPGKVIKEPNLKTTRKPKILRILVRSSSIENIRYGFEKFFHQPITLAVPPAASIALAAVFENL